MQKFIVTSICLFLFTAGNAQQQRIKRRGVTPVTTNSGISKNETFHFKLEDFYGKWQEVSRTHKNNNIVSITDTIYLFFKDDNKVETRDGSKTIIKGEAAIYPPGNILIAAADSYIIISKTGELLVLDDGETFIHTFKKVNQFWSETVGKVAVSQDVFETAIHPSMSNLKGNWGVYRRQAAPGAVDAKTLLIKNLKITSTDSEQKGYGEVTFYNSDKSETMPCVITIQDTAVEIKAGVNQWTFPVYKADGKEFVFGTIGKLLYFAKSF